MSPGIIALVMLGILVLTIMIGFPVAFTMMALGVAFGYYAYFLPDQAILDNRVFFLLTQNTYGVMTNDALVAVPLFLLMGYMVERANILDRLFFSLQVALRFMPGALAVATLVTCALFATATGIVGAVVTLMGLLAFPQMIKAGYDTRLAAGVTCAGGCLGIMIPPSILLIVYGAQAGVSVVKLYAGALLPGFLLAGMYIVYLMGRAFLNPKLGPPVPMDERVHSLPAMLREVLVGTVPLLALIAATLGSILAGLATPTEAAGVGASGALLLMLCYRRFTWPGFQRALHATMATSSMVLLLAVTSNIFGAVFARLGTASWITHSMLSFDLPPTMMLVLVLVLIFLLGWPFEWPAIVLVFLPIFYPVVAAMKIDLVWFGALVSVVLQTAFLSPPVAMSAYYLKQVVRDWSLTTIYAGMFQFMIIQVICIGLLVTFPKIATWFPETLQEAARLQKIPEDHQKILDQQRLAPSLEEDGLK